MTSSDIVFSKVELLDKSNELRKRTIHHFMDIVILTELQNYSMSGYDIMAFIHKKYGIGVSSGTVYAMLYSMEREHLIDGSWRARKRVYKISKKNKSKVQILLRAYAPLQEFLNKTTLPERKMPVRA